MNCGFGQQQLNRKGTIAPYLFPHNPRRTYFLWYFPKAIVLFFVFIWFYDMAWSGLRWGGQRGEYEVRSDYVWAITGDKDDAFGWVERVGTMMKRKLIARNKFDNRDGSMAVEKFSFTEGFKYAYGFLFVRTPGASTGMDAGLFAHYEDSVGSMERYKSFLTDPENQYLVDMMKKDIAHLNETRCVIGKSYKADMDRRYKAAYTEIQARGGVFAVPRDKAHASQYTEAQLEPFGMEFRKRKASPWYDEYSMSFPAVEEYCDFMFNSLGGRAGWSGHIAEHWDAIDTLVSTFARYRLMGDTYRADMRNGSAFGLLFVNLFYPDDYTRLTPWRYTGNREVLAELYVRREFMRGNIDHFYEIGWSKPYKRHYNENGSLKLDSLMDTTLNYGYHSAATNTDKAIKLATPESVMAQFSSGEVQSTFAGPLKGLFLSWVREGLLKPTEGSRYSGYYGKSKPNE